MIQKDSYKVEKLYEDVYNILYNKSLLDNFKKKCKKFNIKNITEWRNKERIVKDRKNIKKYLQDVKENYLLNIFNVLKMINISKYYSGAKKKILNISEKNQLLLKKVETLEYSDFSNNDIIDNLKECKKKIRDIKSLVEDIKRSTSSEDSYFTAFFKKKQNIKKIFDFKSFDKIFSILDKDSKNKVSDNEINSILLNMNNRVELIQNDILSIFKKIYGNNIEKYKDVENKIKDNLFKKNDIFEESALKVIELDSVLGADGHNNLDLFKYTLRNIVTQYNEDKKNNKKIDFIPFIVAYNWYQTYLAINGKDNKIDNDIKKLAEDLANIIVKTVETNYLQYNSQSLKVVEKEEEKYLYNAQNLNIITKEEEKYWHNAQKLSIITKEEEKYLNNVQILDIITEKDAMHIYNADKNLINYFGKLDGFVNFDNSNVTPVFFNYKGFLVKINKSNNDKQLLANVYDRNGNRINSIFINRPKSNNIKDIYNNFKQKENINLITDISVRKKKNVYNDFKQNQNEINLKDDNFPNVFDIFKTTINMHNEEKEIYLGGIIENNNGERIEINEGNVKKEANKIIKYDENGLNINNLYVNKKKNGTIVFGSKIIKDNKRKIKINLENYGKKEFESKNVKITLNSGTYFIIKFEYPFNQDKAIENVKVVPIEKTKEIIENIKEKYIFDVVNNTKNVFKNNNDVLSINSTKKYIEENNVIKSKDLSSKLNENSLLINNFIGDEDKNKFFTDKLKNTNKSKTLLYKN